VYFIEVKTVQVPSLAEGYNHGIDPRDNLTRDKLHKLIQTISIYLKHRKVGEEVMWRLDLACVYVDMKTRQAKVQIVENVS
jgi:Holliday junction resolvase-like predicted endonuclease